MHEHKELLRVTVSCALFARISYVPEHSRAMKREEHDDVPEPDAKRTKPTTVYVACEQYVDDDYKRIDANTKIIGVYASEEGAFAAAFEAMCTGLAWQQLLDEEDADADASDKASHASSSDDESAEQSHASVLTSIRNRPGSWKARFVALDEYISEHRPEPEYNCHAGYSFWVVARDMQP